MSSEEVLVEKISKIYGEISKLESLKPCRDVDFLFSQLVLTCTPPSSIDINNLTAGEEEMRAQLIRLCAESEGLLESHFSAVLATHENPLDHLHAFPYYTNYQKLTQLELAVLLRHYPGGAPRRLAFVGSGALPLTTILLALHHLPATAFRNYDIDPAANSQASRLVSSHPSLSRRVSFHTSDITRVTHGLGDFDVVFLAALVGVSREEKIRVVDHLARHMAPGAFLMLRSAHGARAFLYPVVDPRDLHGFELLYVFHPTDEVINSILLCRKYPQLSTQHPSDHHHQRDLGSVILSNKSCIDEIQAYVNRINRNLH